MDTLAVVQDLKDGIAVLYAKTRVREDQIALSRLHGQAVAIQHALESDG